MIINKPTGMYRDVIPESPDDSGNIIFTISSTNPPRNVLNFQQIPTGVAARRRAERAADAVLRRSNLGPLVLTDKKNNRSSIIRGNSMFNAGEVVEFNGEPADTVNRVNTALETRHDQFRISADNLGVDDDGFDNISKNAENAQRAILDDLEELQKQYSVLSDEIVSKQNSINELTRAINGLDAILSRDPSNESMKDTRDQIESKRSTEMQSKKDTIEELNKIPDKIKQKHDELRAISVFVG